MIANVHMACHWSTKHSMQAEGVTMNAQILFIVCFSASLAAFGIALVCAGLLLILKSER